MKPETMQLFNEACEALGYDPKTVLPDVSCLPFKHRKSATAYHMLMIIIEHAQKKANWQVDYNNPDQRKYWTWHVVKASKKQPAGFGFSDSLFSYDYTSAYVASRLCFPDYQTEREYAEKLEELYEDYKL